VVEPAHVDEEVEGCVAEEDAVTPASHVRLIILRR